MRLEKVFGIFLLVIITPTAFAQSYKVVDEQPFGIWKPLETESFNTLSEAEAYLHSEAYTDDGSQFLKPIEQPTIDGPASVIHYSVDKPPQLATFVTSWYVLSEFGTPASIINSGTTIGCDETWFAQNDGITHKGCSSESDLKDAILASVYPQGVPSSARVEFAGAYHFDAPMESGQWEPKYNEEINRSSILVTQPQSRTVEVWDQASGDVIFTSVKRTDIYECPQYYTASTEDDDPQNWQLCTIQPKREIKIVVQDQSDCCVKAGNPVNLATGNKEYHETSFSWEGESFNLNYISNRGIPLKSGINDDWTHTFAEHLIVEPTSFTFINDEGYAERYLTNDNLHYYSSNMEGSVITRESESNRATKGYWRLDNGVSLKWFSEDGALTRLEKNNHTFTLSYCDQQSISSGLCLNVGDLMTVTSATGRAIDFGYEEIDPSENQNGYSNNYVTRLKEVYIDGVKILTLNYDTNGHFVGTDYGTQDQIHGREYRYGELAELCRNGDGSLITPCDPVKFKDFLTGIVDENGNDTAEGRFATYSYDQFGRGTISTHAHDAGIIRVNYDTDRHGYSMPGYVTTTLASGAKQEVNWTGGVSQPFRKPVRVLKANSSRSLTWIDMGYSDNRMIWQQDALSNRSTYTYDDLHLTGVTRGLDSSGNPTASTKTVETDWSTNFDKPIEQRTLDASGSLVAVKRNAINTRGQVAAKCQVDPENSDAMAYVCGSMADAPSGVRQTRTTYCEVADVSAGTCPTVGLPISVDGPRTDVSDITTLAYYDATDLSGCETPFGFPCHYLGDLESVVDALGHEVQYLSYSPFAQVLKVRDTNGTYTDYIYNARGWLTDRIVRADASGTPSAADAAFHVDYDLVGNVIKTTQPDGSYLAYSYDDAHRLIKITDSLDDAVDYCPDGLGSNECLDAAGNRRVELTLDPDGNITRAVHHVYDEIGKLKETLNASGSPTFNAGHGIDGNYQSLDGYDLNSNLIHSYDGRGNVTERQYDSLNRLTALIRDAGDIFDSDFFYPGPDPATFQATTRYSYNARDQIKAVTDPDNLTTTYTYNGLGDLEALESPDTGTTSYEYDSAGNRTKQIDARGVETDYSFDAMNRLTTIHYLSDPALDVVYSYDLAPDDCPAPSYPIGRVTLMTDSSGSTAYCYDRRGNITRKIQLIVNPIDSSEFTATTVMNYTLGDRLASLRYPSGLVVNYSRDATGRIDGIDYYVGSQAPSPLLSGVDYYPFGPLHQLTFANGRTLTKTYDQNYYFDQVLSSDPNGLVIDASTTDAMGNILAATDSVGATHWYTYDALKRLTGTDTASDRVRFTYDPAGDRQSKLLGWSDENDYAYTVPLVSHRLQSVDGVARSYDAAGNTTSLGGSAFTFDARGRLSKLTVSGAPSAYEAYSYAGNGERTSKTAYTSDYPVGGDVSTLFVHDQAGKLISEFVKPQGSNSIKLGKDYIYADGIPVAIMQWPTGSGAINADTVDGSSTSSPAPYYIETDQLGSPRTVVKPGATTASDVVVWRWDYFDSAFGENAPEQDPDGDGINFTLNLRFPGQYHDVETGTNYNHFRNYEPDTGRYSESDPIGLDGGINTYAYVGNNPLSRVDPTGLVYGNDPYFGLPPNVVMASMGPPPRLPDYASFQLDYYVFSVSATYTANGDIFLGKGISRPYPNPLKGGVSISAGWMLNPCGTGHPTRKQLNDFLNGYSAGAGGYFGVGGSFSKNPSGQGFNLGVGAGGITANPGMVNSYQGNVFGDPQP